MFFYLIFQLQDCIQATLTDWFSTTKEPLKVGKHFWLSWCFHAELLVSLHGSAVVHLILSPQTVKTWCLPVFAYKLLSLWEMNTIVFALAVVASPAVTQQRATTLWGRRIPVLRKMKMTIVIDIKGCQRLTEKKLSWWMFMQCWLPKAPFQMCVCRTGW